MYHQFSAAGETKEAISPETSIVTLDDIQARENFWEKINNKDSDLIWEIIQASMPMIDGHANKVYDIDERKDMKSALMEWLHRALSENTIKEGYKLKAWVSGILFNAFRRLMIDISNKRKKEIPFGMFVPEETKRDTTQDSSEWKNKKTQEVFNEVSPDEDTLIEPGVNTEELIINERHVEEIKEMVADKFGEEGLRIFELIVDDRMGVNEANRALNEELKTRIAPSTFKYQWGIIKEYVKTFLKDMGFAIKEKKQIPATV